MADGGVFVRRCLLLLCLLLFADAQLLGDLEERTTLQGLREAGIPQKSFQEAGISSEDALLYVGFWEDLEYFPLAYPWDREEAFSFENGWHQKRNYGGERLHEGCDIFGSREISGYYPVVSITDGEVEQIGWLPLGGWRIGIRSPGGGYFYYAHLSSYGSGFQEGDQVKAGELLGFLGDSGYGPEGTTGQFAPHLHLGIYVVTDETEEYALNPYPVLQFLQERQKNFFY